MAPEPQRKRRRLLISLDSVPAVANVTAAPAARSFRKRLRTKLTVDASGVADTPVAPAVTASWPYRKRLRTKTSPGELAVKAARAAALSVAPGTPVVAIGLVDCPGLFVNAALAAAGSLALRSVAAASKALRLEVFVATDAWERRLEELRKTVRASGVPLRVTNIKQRLEVSKALRNLSCFLRISRSLFETWAHWTLDSLRDELRAYVNSIEPRTIVLSSRPTLVLVTAALVRRVSAVRDAYEAASEESVLESSRLRAGGSRANARAAFARAVAAQINNNLHEEARGQLDVIAVTHGKHAELYEQMARQSDEFAKLVMAVAQLTGELQRQCQWLSQLLMADSVIVRALPQPPPEPSNAPESTADRSPRY